MFRVLIFLLLFPFQVWATTTLYVDTDAASPTHPTYNHLADVITYLQGYNGGVLDDDFVVECSGVAADNPATISGFTASTPNTITINGEGAGVGGQIDSTKYRIDGTSDLHHGVLHIDASIDLVVNDIQLKSTGINTYSAVVSWSANAINGSSTFNRCLSLFDSNGYASPLGWDQYLVNASGNLTTTITNTIFRNIGSGTDVYGVWMESDAHLYNCVLNGFYRAARCQAGTAEIINSAVFNNTDDFYGTITIDYCASDDGDGTNPVTPTDWAAVFEDYANGDFRLVTGSDLIGAGTDLSSTFTTDMAGATRTTPWDIGAFMYATAATTPWRYYNGSAWIDADAYRYDGSTWQSLTTKRYDGTWQ